MTTRDLTGEECVAVLRGMVQHAPDLQKTRTITGTKPSAVKAIKANRDISVPMKRAVLCTGQQG